MNSLGIVTFGRPCIYMNGKQVNFQFKKAEAVVYTTAAEPGISRDKLCSMIWGEHDEYTAKKNLRNALYSIKKKLGIDLFDPLEKKKLCFSPELEVSCDLSEISGLIAQPDCLEEDILRLIKLFSDGFLQDFHFKDSELFYAWAREKAAALSLSYVHKLKTSASCFTAKGLLETAELCCRKLISIDEYDEESYRLLMKVMETKSYPKAGIDIYYELKSKLYHELEITPSPQTEQLYARLKKMMDELTLPVSAGGTGIPSVFFGRAGEMKTLAENYHNFLFGNPFAPVAVIGEIGVGKTRLLENFITQIDSLYIVVSCYEIDYSFQFKIIDTLLDKLTALLLKKNMKVEEGLLYQLSKSFPSVSKNMDFKKYRPSSSDSKYYGQVPDESLIYHLLSQICAYGKLTILIDDIQWCDQKSMFIIKNIVQVLKEKLLLVLTCRESHEYIPNTFLMQLSADKALQKIYLHRFSREETCELVNLCTPKWGENGDAIFSESEGNPLFINEMLNNLLSGMPIGEMTSKLNSVVGGRIESLSEEALSVLQVASVFQKNFYFEDINTVLHQDELHLADLFEKMFKKNLIKETKAINGSVTLDFTHQKIREYVYSNISMTKKSVLHKTIACLYEKKLTSHFSDVMLYPYIIHHYSKCNEIHKLFYYKVMDLYYRLNINHEIFPLASQKEIGQCIGFERDDGSYELLLNEIDDIWLKIGSEKSQEDIRAHIFFLFIYGRYYKNCGNALKGIPALETMIECAREIQDYSHVFEGYVQLIHHYMNVEEISKIGDCLALMKPCLNNFDQLYLSRYQLYLGYYQIQLGSFAKGEKILLSTIELLLDKKYVSETFLNVAAAYTYIGDSKFLQNDFSQAFEGYLQAFDYCDEDRDCAAVAIILSKMGVANYWMGDTAAAKYYLTQSIKKYNKTMFYWERGKTYYYLAKINYESADMNKFKMYLQQAKIYLLPSGTHSLEQKIQELENLLN